ncbi:hypothetical protein EDD91_1348 [Streptomyces sp. KS 21]|nr:hypothetical protein EDD91_1348 [Streptomyces sp. KS 21]
MVGMPGLSLGSPRCSDPETGMSLIEVSVLNPHATRAAWYEETLQFTTSDGAVFATETAYLGRAEPGKQAKRDVAVARPALVGNEPGDVDDVDDADGQRGEVLTEQSGGGEDLHRTWPTNPGYWWEKPLLSWRQTCEASR